jgi:hypothetical protein
MPPAIERAAATALQTMLSESGRLRANARMRGGAASRWHFVGAMSTLTAPTRHELLST